MGWLGNDHIVYAWKLICRLPRLVARFCILIPATVKVLRVVVCVFLHKAYLCKGSTYRLQYSCVSVVGPDLH